MRIAVSGSHRVGKTTLVEALAASLPDHDAIPEPYHLLEDEGEIFPAMPTLADFERQLERSIDCIEEYGSDAVFDRCPLDFLGYLGTHDDADAFGLQDWLSRIADAVARLDLVVFVPVEEPDRIDVPRDEATLRADVDAALHDVIVDDMYGLGFELLVVTGEVDERIRRATERISALRTRRSS